MTQVVVTSLWPSMIWFKCGLVCVRFVVDKVALGQFFSPLLQFSLLSISLQILHPSFILTLSLWGHAGQAIGLPNKTVFCQIFGGTGQRSAFTARDQRINSLGSVQYIQETDQTVTDTEQTVCYESPNLIASWWQRIILQTTVSSYYNTHKKGCNKNTLHKSMWHFWCIK